MNVLDKEGQKSYHQKTFTEEGLDSAKTFLANTLVKEYVTRKEEDYPFQIGMVLGLPLLKKLHVISSKEELLGRIKAYMHLIGIELIRHNDEKGNVYEIDMRTE